MGETVLIVEDNPTIIKLYTLFFADQKWEIVIARRAEEAIDIWEAMEIDLILTDVKLAGISGIEATRLIRDREAELNRQRTPILGTSALEDLELKNKCLISGMDDFLPRPLPLERLLNRMQGLLDSCRQPEQSLV